MRMEVRNWELLVQVWNEELKWIQGLDSNGSNLHGWFLVSLHMHPLCVWSVLYCVGSTKEGNAFTHVKTQREWLECHVVYEEGQVDNALKGHLGNQCKEFGCVLGVVMRVKSEKNYTRGSY